MANTAMPIKEDSNVLKLLDSDIFPYFKDVFTTYITELKKFADTYMKYIIVESKHVDVIYKLTHRPSSYVGKVIGKAGVEVTDKICPIAV